MNEPIMVFNIYIDKSAISSFNGDCNSVTIIPFTGEVRSELFSGVILPGAVDVLHATPRFITDSKALCGYFSQNIFRTEIHPTEEGVNILVYAARSL